LGEVGDTSILKTEHPLRYRWSPPDHCARGRAACRSGLSRSDL